MGRLKKTADPNVTTKPKLSTTTKKRQRVKIEEPGRNNREYVPHPTKQAEKQEEPDLQLILHSRMKYQLQNDQWVSSDLKIVRTSWRSFEKESKQKPSSTNVPSIHQFIWCYLPTFLQNDVWNRHQYSLYDIERTFAAFPERWLWRYLAIHGVPATQASSKPSLENNNPIQLVFSAQATALKKISQLLLHQNPEYATRPSVTWDMSKPEDPNGDGKTHIFPSTPVVPVHRIPRESLLELSLSCCEDVMTEEHERVKECRDIFKWRNILLVVLNKMDDTLVKVVRIIPWECYQQSYGLPNKWVQSPELLWHTEQKCWYTLTDETFFFYSPSEEEFEPIAKRHKF